MILKKGDRAEIAGKYVLTLGTLNNIMNIEKTLPIDGQPEQTIKNSRSELLCWRLFFVTVLHTPDDECGKSDK